MVKMKLGEGTTQKTTVTKSAACVTWAIRSKQLRNIFNLLKFITGQNEREETTQNTKCCVCKL